MFRKIVLAVQGISLLVRVHRCLCSFQMCFCFSLGTMLTIPREPLCQIQLISMQHTCPRNVFLKAFVFGVLNNSASGFLTLIHILELLFPGDLFNYLLVLGGGSDLLATGNIIWIWSLISSQRQGPESLLEMQGMEAVVTFRSLILQNLDLQQMDAVSISQHLNRRKTAGLEDTKAMCMWKSY